MSRARTALFLTVLMATVLTGYWLLQRTNPPAHDEPSPQAAAQNVVAEAPPVRAPVASNEAPLNADSDLRAGAVDCLTPAQLDSDPALAEEYARLDAVTTSGPTIASYRGLSSTQLSHLVIQGDSAAMAVLGAMSVMRARNLPEDLAVGYLLREDPSVWSFSLAQPLAPEVVQHLKEASDWFYKAALHGRLLALENAGEIIAMVAGTPAELGWIEAEYYESLEAYERYALDPKSVYHALAFELAPELRSGPFGAINAALTQGGERQQLILDQLAQQFHADQQAAGLPPIAVSESKAMSTEALAAMLCKP